MMQALAEKTSKAEVRICDWCISAILSTPIEVPLSDEDGEHHTFFYHAEVAPLDCYEVMKDAAAATSRWSTEGLDDSL